ncbi:MAG TPA: sucrose-6-phosphate hydrolase [Lachnospiraceae bacterium]|nr:sucrose-6-phosphate hydrolase [Lachnospiraceae bacterium]
MSSMLEKARTFEKEHGDKIGSDERPVFHLTPWSGWMNDPNGFCRYQGQYHLFYQYNPYAAHWDSMHWGHAVSPDLLHWKYLPAALAPDGENDGAGCFSGSAVPLDDGRLLLMYTAVEERIENGEKRIYQTQNLAVGDGLNFEKYSGNPVLDSRDLPEGSSKEDFRDPKMLRLSDGSLACVIGSRPSDGSGQILFYTSEEGFHWNFKAVLDQNRNRFGKMWECPDFFQLDGRWVLLTSPQDMQQAGAEYHPGNGTTCFIGNYDEKTGKFTEVCDQAIDYGIDFYAPQTLETPDGRRIMIGWMQNWDACAMREPDAPWAGQMTLPRELEIRNDKLYQHPIAELSQYRIGKVQYKDLSVKDTVSLDGISGRCIDLEAEITAADEENPFYKFSIRFAEGNGHYTEFVFRPFEETVTVDRSFCGSRRDLVHVRECLVPGTRNGHLKFRLILDRFSAELFLQDGEKVMTVTFFTEQEADRISFHAVGEARMDVVKYDLNL